MSINQIRNRLDVGSFSVYAGWRFRKYLHFSFSDRRNNKHDAEENISARKAFIPKYFEYEKRAKLWVRPTNEEAAALETMQLTLSYLMLDIASVKLI